MSVIDGQLNDSRRTVRAHMTPGAVEPGALRGSTVIVVDNLRASTTIVAAMAAGARRVVPVVSVEEALAAKARLGAEVLLGGERGGVKIDGFDLGNSPLEYTAERVRGRTIVFTTTNGTVALARAQSAGVVLVGCLANASAVASAATRVGRPVEVLCAGTNDQITLDDCLAAGAIIGLICTRGYRHDGDGALICVKLWNELGAGGAERAHAAMRMSRGGRNLLELGMEGDVEYCSRLDVCAATPLFDAVRGEIV